MPKPSLKHKPAPDVVPPAQVPVLQVAQLLAAAGAAHDQYRMALQLGQPDQALAALQRAYQLRVDAEVLDVAGVALSWMTDGRTHPHDALLAFYDDQIR